MEVQKPRHQRKPKSGVQISQSVHPYKARSMKKLVRRDPYVWAT